MKTIICIPGLGGRSNLFDKYRAPLFEFNLKFVDVLNWQEAQKEINNLVEKEEEVIFLCNCYGIQLALRAIEKYPSKAYSLIVIEPFFEEFLPFSKILFVLNRDVLNFMKWTDKLGLKRKTFSHVDYNWLEKLPLFLQPFYDMKHQSMTDYFGKLDDVLTFRFPNRVNVKTFFIFSPSGFVRDPNKRARLKNVFVNSDFIELGEKTHNIMTLSSGEIAQAVKKWLGKTKMDKISCIICAFNEEPRINNVLAALKNHPLIDEVIVIDDGSQDGTGKRVEESSWVKLISHEKNLGKSQAMCTGILNSKNDLLMFLDADLINIKKDDISALAMPVLENKSDVSMTLRKNSLGIYRLIGLDFCSGERVIYKEHLIGQIEKIKLLPGYGIEVFMNRLIINKKLRVRIIKWNTVMVTTKMGKIGFWPGLKGEIDMLLQIKKALAFTEILTQNYQLLKLSRSNQERR